MSSLNDIAFGNRKTFELVEAAVAIVQYLVALVAKEVVYPACYLRRTDLLEELEGEYCLRRIFGGQASSSFL